MPGQYTADDGGPATNAYGAARRPNVLVFIADQHNARLLGAAGDLAARTPHLDRLAGGGVLFDHAYAVSPICSPSRISISTGNEPATHGYYGNSNWGLTDDCPAFLPRLLRRSGYQTALVGRSHTVSRWDRDAFDRVAYMNFGDCDRYRLDDNPWLIDLIVHGAADHYDVSLPATAAPEGGFTSSMPLERCEESWVARTAIDYLRTRDPRRPFFLQVGYDHPHDPLAPPAPFDRLFSPEMVELPPNHVDTFEGKPAPLARRRHQPGGYPYTPRDAGHLRWLVAKEYALLALVDASIGRILAELERQGELERTLVVYTADHGDFAGEHGMVLKNLGIYESVHRVPLIVSWPRRFPGGRRTGALVELVDLYPTLLRCAGVPVPACDGLDLTPVLEGGPGGRDHVICDWETIRAIRTREFRLVEYLGAPRPQGSGGAGGATDAADAGTGELYALVDDPGELVNRWADPACRAAKDTLLALLRRRIPADRVVRTSHVDERRSERARAWFAEDSAIVAMWRYGVRWSHVRAHLEDRPEGGKRLTVPAAALARRFPFRLPELALDQPGAGGE